MKPLSLFLLLLPFLSNAQNGDTASRKTDTTVTMLNTVTVKASRPYIENRPDRTVMNIEGRIGSAGQNALELLRQAPGVVVDANENIQAGGKSGVAVYIDGRPTQLTGQDLAQLLKSIDASNIKEIEIITNPSSRFDASGNAGIINFKLKRSLTNGFNGSLAANYVQSTHARGSGSVNLNWRRNKWNYFLNGSINRGLQHTIANNDRTNYQKQFTQRSLEIDSFHGAGLRTGIDYSLNKYTTVGVLWMYNDKYTGMDNRSRTLLQQKNGEDSSIQTRSTAPFQTRRYAYNLNYVYSRDQNSLTLDADRTRYRSSVFNQLTNSFSDQADYIYARQANTYDQQVQIDLYSIKADYTTTLYKKWKLESGLKWLQTNTTNALEVQQQEQASWKRDTLRTNYFDLKEGITAGYASLSRDLKHLSMQLGLRVEHASVKGRSLDLKGMRLERPDTSYTNAFPTLFLQYNLPSRDQLGLTVTRRIDRPNYQDQNPFIYALDALNSEQGNAYLMPQFTNSMELSYTHQYATSVKLRYSRTSNYIEQLTYQEGDNIIMIPQNAGTRQMLNLVFNTPVKLRKWWNIYLYAEPFYQAYDVLLEGFGSKEKQAHQSWGFNGYMSHTFTLPRNWKAELNGWFNYQNQTTIYRSKPLGSLNLGLQKSFEKPKLTLRLNVTDLLNTQRWEQRAVTQNLNLLTYRKWESRNLTLGLSWRFGNTKIKSARERETGTEEDLKRIK